VADQRAAQPAGQIDPHGAAHQHAHPAHPGRRAWFRWHAGDLSRRGRAPLQARGAAGRPAGPLPVGRLPRQQGRVRT